VQRLEEQGAAGPLQSPRAAAEAADRLAAGAGSASGASSAPASRGWLAGEGVQACGAGVGRWPGAAHLAHDLPEGVPHAGVGGAAGRARAARAGRLPHALRRAVRDAPAPVVPAGRGVIRGTAAGVQAGVVRRRQPGRSRLCGVQRAAEPAADPERAPADAGRSASRGGCCTEGRRRGGAHGRRSSGQLAAGGWGRGATHSYSVLCEATRPEVPAVAWACMRVCAGGGGARGSVDLDHCWLSGCSRPLATDALHRAGGTAARYRHAPNTDLDHIEGVDDQRSDQGGASGSDEPFGVRQLRRLRSGRGWPRCHHSRLLGRCAGAASHPRSVANVANLNYVHRCPRCLRQPLLEPAIS
jgi:hypothetical protein